MVTDPEFLEITDELERVASYALCSLCGKLYCGPPGHQLTAEPGECLLADHIEGYEAVMAYRKARG